MVYEVKMLARLVLRSSNQSVPTNTRTPYPEFYAASDELESVDSDTGRLRPGLGVLDDNQLKDEDTRGIGDGAPDARGGLKPSMWTFASASMLWSRIMPGSLSESEPDVWELAPLTRPPPLLLSSLERPWLMSRLLLLRLLLL